MKNISLLSLSKGLALSLGAAFVSGRALAVADLGENNPGDNWDVSATDQFTYDNNLFRLPSGIVNISALLGPRAAPQDHINTASVSADVHWLFGQQSFDANALIDDNRFSRNDDFNNSAGNGKAVWNWRVGGHFSGTAGIDYAHSLAGFGYTGFLGRDLIDKSDYFGTANYQVGPRWSLLGGVTESDVTHSALSEEAYDAHIKSGNGGIGCATSPNITVGLQYGYTDAIFPRGIFVNGLSFAQDYDENTTQFFLNYTLTEKTLINASAGYLKRSYPNFATNSFSGDIWKVSAHWLPTDKTQVMVTVYRQLQAYVEAQSNYFVDKGAAITPVWSPTEKLQFTFGISWDDEAYINSSLNALDVESRHDRLSSEVLSAIYWPIRNFSFTFSYRNEQRGSNDFAFKNDDKTASLAVTFKWRRDSMGQ